MYKLKKLPNMVKSTILCLVLIFAIGKILALIYPASDPNSKECPDIFIILLFLISPLISEKVFPLQPRSKAVKIFLMICKVIWITLWSVGIIIWYINFLIEDNNPVIFLLLSIILCATLIFIAQKKKKTERSTGSRRNPSILPAPPIQSSPPRSRRYSLARVDAMDGHEFEHFTADLLRKLGYQNVEVTPASGDQGVDVLAEKDGIRYAFQCKCYSSDLGNTPVQEVHAGKYIYQCHVGVVITNRYFTQGAKDAAKATGILLWDRDKLQEILQSVA